MARAGLLMNAGIPTFPIPIISAICHGIPAFLWTVIAWDLCHYAYQRRPTSHFFRIAPVVAVLMALHFILHIVKELTPTELNGRFPGLHGGMEMVIELIALGSAGAFRHLVRVMPIDDDHASRAWLLTNYGILAGLGLLTVLLLHAGHHASAMMISGAYMVVIGGFSIARMRKVAQRGAWSPGGLQVRAVDVAFGLTALVGGGGLMLVWLVSGAEGPEGVVDQAIFLVFHTAYGLGFALPFAARRVGRLVRVFAEASIVFTLAAVFVWVIPARLASIAHDEARRLAELASVLLLALLLGTMRTLMASIGRWKWAMWARWPLWRRMSPMYALFHPSARPELQRFLTTLSPEDGVIACCERATKTLVNAMQLRGAAIVLLDHRGTAQHGQTRAAALEAAWSSLPVDQLPTRAFAAAELRELPLSVKHAFLDSDAVGVVPIISPRQTWGHLFIWTGFMETATSDEGVETLQAFADQFALVLDSAELLARALVVERSLAHAEKLAAIGELAARVAHEIRNPITAARSLAQQLTREGQAQFQTEHALILTELERVERQVAALLRFARRDDFQFEPIDLTALLRSTVNEFRPRCTAAGIRLDLAADPVVARGDRDKLRQVLINLIENAVDALADAPEPRQLALSLGRQNGTAHLEIRDNGVGVPPDALAHLFEPFFSLKSHGTGLGLSIAKRTIDAHGGRIAARINGGTGLAFDIELPLDAERDSVATTMSQGAARERNT